MAMQNRHRRYGAVRAATLFAQHQRFSDGATFAPAGAL
jgi:hypothetical protein